MIHDLDLVHTLVPGAVADVRAEGLIEYGPHADEVFALLRFANGTIAKLETSRVATERKRGLRAVYADGVVEIDFLSRTVTNTTPRPAGRAGTGRSAGRIRGRLCRRRPGRGRRAGDAGTGRPGAGNRAVDRGSLGRGGAHAGAQARVAAGRR